MAYEQQRQKTRRRQPNPRPRPRAGGGKLRRRAVRDIGVEFAPQETELQRQRQALGPLYGSVTKNLEALIPQYQQMTAGTQGAYQQGLNQLSQDLGGAAGSFLGGEAGSELAGALGLFGAAGAAGLGNIASTSQRNLGYTQSGIRQAGLQELAAQQALDRAGMALAQQKGPATTSRLDQLLDMMRQERLAGRELNIREKLAADQLGLDWAKFRFTKQQDRRRRRGARQTARGLRGGGRGSSYRGQQGG